MNRVDVLFVSAGIEAEIVAAAEVVPDRRMPVAAAGHLVALKLLALDAETGPQDAADLPALRSVLDTVEHRMARAVEPIVERESRAVGHWSPSPSARPSWSTVATPRPVGELVDAQGCAKRSWLVVAVTARRTHVSS